MLMLPTISCICAWGLTALLPSEDAPHHLSSHNWAMQLAYVTCNQSLPSTTTKLAPMHMGTECSFNHQKMHHSLNRASSGLKHLDNPIDISDV